MTFTGYAMILFAYLLGSFSSAITFCKLAGLPDPREHGSNNPGATNVLRIGGKTAALGVLMCDILKGMLPVALALHLALPPSTVGFALDLKVEKGLRLHLAPYCHLDMPSRA